MTSTMTTDAEGNKTWRNLDGKLHRIGGPAYEGADGTKQWYVDGKDITNEVEEWFKSKRIYSKLKRNNFQLNEDELIQFKLRFS